MAMVKKLAMAVAGAAFVSLGAAYLDTPTVDAAIVAVGDSGSWLTGSNAIANQGFNMVTVPNSPEPEFSSVSTLSSSVGNLTFSSPAQELVVGSGWKTWSNDYNGEVYYNGDNAPFEITLPDDIVAFDLYLQPEEFGLFDIELTTMSGATSTVSLSQNIQGNGGAEYFGFYATDGDSIKSITIKDKSGGAANGFAVAQLRMAHVPEPLTIGGSAIALAFGWRMRRKRSSSKNTWSKSQSTVK